jgi:hypothetical protein
MQYIKVKLLREQQGYWTRANFYLEGHFARALCPLALHAGSVLKPGLARRVDPGPGRPWPETGPGGGKNPLGNWPGETRSTRSNPGETQSIFFFHIASH